MGDVVPALRTNSEGLGKVLEELVGRYKGLMEGMEGWKVRLLFGFLLWFWAFFIGCCSFCHLNLSFWVMGRCLSSYCSSPASSWIPYHPGPIRFLEGWLGSQRAWVKLRLY